jgi:hypothetical protein
VGRSIEQEKVRERPADVNAHNPTHVFFLPKACG